MHWWAEKGPDGAASFQEVKFVSSILRDTNRLSTEYV
jgi:hypothetical protein